MRFDDCTQQVTSQRSCVGSSVVLATCRSKRHLAQRNLANRLYYPIVQSALRHLVRGPRFSGDAGSIARACLAACPAIRSAQLLTPRAQSAALRGQATARLGCLSKSSARLSLLSPSQKPRQFHNPFAVRMLCVSPCLGPHHQCRRSSPSAAGGIGTTTDCATGTSAWSSGAAGTQCAAGR